MLRPYNNGDRMSVTLCINGKRYGKRLHNLVANEFIPNPSHTDHAHNANLDVKSCTSPAVTPWTPCRGYPLDTFPPLHTELDTHLRLLPEYLPAVSSWTVYHFAGTHWIPSRGYTLDTFPRLHPGHPPAITPWTPSRAYRLDTLPLLPPVHPPAVTPRDTLPRLHPGHPLAVIPGILSRGYALDTFPLLFSLPLSLSRSLYSHRLSVH